MFGPDHSSPLELSLELELSVLINSQLKLTRISPDGHSSFLFLVTKTGISLKLSSSTKLKPPRLPTHRASIIRGRTGFHV